MVGDPSRLHLWAGWFICVTYLIGGPVMAFAEFNGQLLSDRFGFNPGFVYAVAFVQFICAIALFSDKWALWSLAVLTILSAGAVGAHLWIQSPLTGIPAAVYTVLQVWVGMFEYRKKRASKVAPSNRPPL